MSAPLNTTAIENSKKRSLIKRFILAGILLLILFAAGGVWIAWHGTGVLSAASLLRQEILLASLDRSGDADIYLVLLGQKENTGKLLAEDATASSSTHVWLFDQGKPPDLFGTFGGFIPNSDRILLLYKEQEKGNNIIQQMNLQDKEPSLVIKTRMDLDGMMLAKPDLLFLQESKEESALCNVAKPNAEAELITKGDACTISLDGSTIVVCNSS